MNYKKLLLEEALPYWLSIGKDEEAGGLFTAFTQEGPQKEAEKNIWFQGRALWTYSMAWRLLEQWQEYLDICAHIYPFLKKCLLKNGRLPFMVSREGNPRQVRPVYYYSEMFAVMGCAQYYRICKDPEVWETAETLFETIFQLYLANRYSTQELPSKELADCKTFGLHMAMLATAQFMRNAAADPGKYDAVCAMAVSEMELGGYLDPEKDILHEHTDLNGQLLTGAGRNTSVPGHIYEAAWFILCEAEIKEDARILALGKRMLDSAMPQDFENITHVIPTVYDLTKPLEESMQGSYLAWPQQEAVIAFRLGYQLFHEPKYLELSRLIEKAMFDHYDRFKGAIWFREILEQDGQWISPLPQGNHINGPFHYERYLMAMHALEETGSILTYMA